MATGTPTVEWPRYIRRPLSSDGGIDRFASDGYAENFGVQWNRFLRTQLDSYTGLPLSHDRVARCMGNALFTSLSGRHVLEAGCGAGRFTEVLLKQKAFVTSIDLSSAVVANARNFPPGPSHRIAQADILDLPFEPQQFDAVICLGVLQHLPNPEAGIAQLYNQVRPGGWLIIDHYTPADRPAFSSLKPLYRAWLKRQPAEKRLRIVEGMVDTFLPIHRALRNVYPAWFLLCRVSPIVTFYRTYPQLTEPLQREFAMLDTHDALTDWHKHLRTREQIAQTLDRLGADNIECWYGGNGVEARCQRPITGAN